MPENCYGSNNVENVYQEVYTHGKTHWYQAGLYAHKAKLRK